MTGYSNYQPHGETLHFAGNYVEDSMILFSQASEFRRILGDVVRPCGDNIWLTCAIDGTWINVRDPEPSPPHWQVVRRDSVAAGVRHLPVDPTAVARVVDELSDDALMGVFREALDSSTAPSGYFATFDQLSPTAAVTRVADDHLIGADGTFSAVFYDQEVTFSTRKVDGMTWLDEPAEGVPFQSPVTYSVRFDGSPGAMVVVHWSRWLEKGTGEHEELQAAITSLIEAGWRPETTSYHFEL